MGEGGVLGLLPASYVLFRNQGFGVLFSHAVSHSKWRVVPMSTATGVHVSVAGR